MWGKVAITLTLLVCVTTLPEVALGQNPLLTPLAVKCAQDINIAQDVVLSYASDLSADIPEDQDSAVRLLDCIFGSNIDDNNEVIVSDGLKGFTDKYFIHVLKGKSEDEAKKVAVAALEECKTKKGTSKGSTAVKTVNCIKKVARQNVS